MLYMLICHSIAFGTKERNVLSEFLSAVENLIDLRLIL